MFRRDLCALPLTCHSKVCTPVVAESLPYHTPCANVNPRRFFAPGRATAERDRIRQQVSLLTSERASASTEYS